MNKRTVLLKIPKESVLNKITKNHSKSMNGEIEDGKIKIYKGSVGSKWRATLEDYKIPTEKISTSNASAEAGKIGTKMIYRSGKSTGRECREVVEDHEF